MADPFGFRGGPTLKGVYSPMDAWQSADDAALSRTQTFFDMRSEGGLKSFFAGTEYRSFITPEGNPELKEKSAYDYAKQATEMLPGAGLIPLARKLYQSTYNEKQPQMTEEEYKKSIYYREGVPWDGAMTEQRAAALAEQFDTTQRREYFASKHPWAGFLGGLMGGAIDPINFVPVGGPLIKAAAAYKTMKMFGPTAARFLAPMITSSFDAATNVALIGLATRGERSRYGDDVSFQATMMQIGMGALVGAGFGAAHAGWGIYKGRVDPSIVDAALRIHAEKFGTLTRTKASLTALNEAIDPMIRGQDINLSPNAVEHAARMAEDMKAATTLAEDVIALRLRDGGLSETQARRTAQLYGAQYAARARQANMTVEEALAYHPLPDIAGGRATPRVLGQDAADVPGRTFEQGGEPGSLAFLEEARLRENELVAGFRPGEGDRQVELSDGRVATVSRSSPDSFIIRGDDGSDLGGMGITTARGAPYATSTHVNLKRQGLATALYDAAEAALGRRMVPSPTYVSPEAMAFWKARLARMEPSEKQALLAETLRMGQEAKVGKSARERVDKLGYVEPEPVTVKAEDRFDGEGIAGGREQGATGAPLHEGGAGGGGRSGPEAVARAVRENADTASSTDPKAEPPRLTGLPKESVGPNRRILAAAARYLARAGMLFRRQAFHVKALPERGARIAAAYDAMVHAPNDPTVRAAYRAMIDETVAQYQAIKEMGLKIEMIPDNSPDPYPLGPKQVPEDLARGHLWVYPTRSGFGTDTAGSAAAMVDNPLLEPTNEFIGDHQLLANDVFRIVHDVFGHGKEGVGFGASGEENAWQSHVRMYSPLAARAMTSETRGQNSWVNYGPHGEHNRLNQRDTIYADQKVGLMPEWTATEGLIDDAVDADRVFYQSEVPGNEGGFEPDLRETATVDEADLPPKTVLVGSNPSNATAQIAGVDATLAAHPNPEASAEAWANMEAHALGTKEVPAPPYKLIADLKNKAAGLIDKIRGLTRGQIDDAAEGFRNAALFRQAYVAGTVNARTTGKLFMWSILSRSTAPYVQESMFIDAFRGIDHWMDLAARGDFDRPEVLAAYNEWARSVAPAGSGQPSGGATSNLTSFGRDFLRKMSQRGSDGVTLLQKMHDLMSDPSKSGKDIRRWFHENAEGVGIDNKVLSFTLLVAGYKDLMVLDRVQMRNMWDDGRYSGRNLYDGRYEPKMINGKVKPAVVAGSSLSKVGAGVRGLMIYEAIERALARKIKAVYKAVGRAGDASISRYHWESWVASSQQEASHASLDAILREAKGIEDPLEGVTAKAGEYGTYAYGARYGRDQAGVPYFEYQTPAGSNYRFTLGAFGRFLDAVKDPKSGVVPKKFRVTESGDAPWYDRAGVDRERLDELAGIHGRRTGDGGQDVRPDATGQAVPDLGPAGGRPRAGEGARADRGADTGAEERIAEAARQEDLVAQQRLNAVNERPPLFQSTRGGRRGQIRFTPENRSIISIFQNADASTALHESGHFFLNMLKTFAEGPHSTPELRADWEVVRAWWRNNPIGIIKDSPPMGLTPRDVNALLDNGTTGDLAKDRALEIGMHEQWARGFERYLREGKAPTPELRSAFQQFKNWLIEIYKKAKELKVSLTPEMRAVFDRMLGSDRPIPVRKLNADGTIDVKALAQEPDVKPVLDELLKRPSTHNEKVDGETLWTHPDPLKWGEDRVYNFNGHEVDGMSAARDRLADESETAAFRNTGRPIEPVLKEKKMFLVVGLPAAGKSTIAEALGVKYKAALPDADEVKQVIPEYDDGRGSTAVHHESTFINDLVINKLMGEGKNVVVQKLGAHIDHVNGMLELARKNGYTAVLVDMHIEPDLGLRRMLGRFYETERIIPLNIYEPEVAYNPRDVYVEATKQGKFDGYVVVRADEGHPARIAEVGGRTEDLGAGDEFNAGGTILRRRANDGQSYSQLGQGEPQDRLIQGKVSVSNPIDPTLSTDAKVTELVRLSNESAPAVKEFLAKVDRNFDTVSEDNFKKPEKIAEKASRPQYLKWMPWFGVEHINDAYRFSTYLNTLHNIPEIAAMAKRAGFEILELDNSRAVDPDMWGWRGTNIDLRMPNGQIVEYQLVTPEQNVASHAGGGHEIYEKWRSAPKELPPEQHALREADMAKSRVIFQKAWDDYLARSGDSPSELRASLSRADASVADTSLKSSSKSPVVKSEPPLTQAPLVNTADSLSGGSRTYTNDGSSLNLQARTLSIDGPPSVAEGNTVTQPKIDTSLAAPEPPPVGLKEATAAVGKPDTPKTLAEQFGVDLATGEFDEILDVEVMREMGLLDAEHEAALKAADETAEQGEAYASALKAALFCIV